MSNKFKNVAIVLLVITNVASLCVLGYLAVQILKGGLASVSPVSNFAVHKTGFQDMILLDKTQPTNLPTTLSTQSDETNARMLRLGDSLIQCRQVVNDAMQAMVDSIPDGFVMPYAQELKYDKAFADLSAISYRLSMQLDSAQLVFIEGKGKDLSGIIKQFDPKIGELNKFSSTLASVAQYVGIAVNVFSSALSSGISLGSTTKATVAAATAK